MVYQMPEMNQNEIDKVNQSCYDNCSSNWDRFPFPNVLPKLIERFRNPALGNRVLDIGSGTGVLAKWLSEQQFEVVCLDPSPEMVRRCKEKGLFTLQTSFQDYQIDSQFGMVFAILSLIHVPKADFSAQLKKISDVLPSGGIFFLGMLEGKNEGFFEGPPYPRFFAYYTPAEISAKVSPYFTQLDYSYSKSSSGGYMLFTLRKK